LIGICSVFVENFQQDFFRMTISSSSKGGCGADWARYASSGAQAVQLSSVPR
jgi:hypothetical protein